MSSQYRKVKFSEFLTQDLDSVAVDRNTVYPFAGLSGFGNGLFKRSSLQGDNTTYKTFNRLREGQMVFSKVKGWEGAIALVSPEHHGLFLSPQYPTFTVNESIANPSFIGLFCKLPSVWERLLAGSKGMGARRTTISEVQFLNLEIPLPPLQEQQRLVTRLEQVQTTVTEAKRLRDEQQHELRLMLRQQFRLAIADAPHEPMGQVAPIVRRPIELDEDTTYHELGIRSFGKGTFHKAGVPGVEVGTKKLYYIQPGDLLFSNVFAWEGAIAIAKSEDAGRVGSHRFISCLCDEEKALPEFLLYYFLTPEGMVQINAASPGGAGRNKTLGLEKLERIQVPVPSLDIQRAFLALHSRIGQLTTTQHAAQEELDLLLPSALDKAFRGEL